MPAVRTATAAEIPQLQRAASELHDYMKGPVALALSRRWVLFHALADRNVGGLLPATADVQKLVSDNLAMDTDTEHMALAMRGLDRGELQLAAWNEATERGEGAMHLGIVKAGTLQAGMGQWQVLPVVVTWAVRAAFAVGAWVLADGYVKSKKAEADADALRAQTSARVASAVTQLSAKDPARGAQLADALKAAIDAANNVQPSFIDQISQGLKKAVEGVTGAAESLSPWVILAGVYFLSRRKNPSMGYHARALGRHAWRKTKSGARSARKRALKAACDRYCP